MQIKDDWQAFSAALAPLLAAFGPYSATLNTLIVKLAQVREGYFLRFFHTVVVIIMCICYY